MQTKKNSDSPITKRTKGPPDRAEAEATGCAGQRDFSVEAIEKILQKADKAASLMALEARHSGTWFVDIWWLWCNSESHSGLTYRWWCPFCLLGWSASRVVSNHRHVKRHQLCDPSVFRSGRAGNVQANETLPGSLMELSQANEQQLQGFFYGMQLGFWQEVSQIPFFDVLGAP